MILPARIYQAIDLAARRAPVDINLLGALIWRESNFDPNAIGDQGHSVGLGQLHDQGAGAGYTVEQRKDPDLNARVTALYLRSCLDATPSPEAALSAYNQGLGGWRVNGILDSQRPYIADIMGKWAEFQRDGLHPDSGPQPPAVGRPVGPPVAVPIPGTDLTVVISVIEAVI